MELIQPPMVIYRPPQSTLGIRVSTPFRGMLAVRDALLAELFDWLDRESVVITGPSFLRHHVIDMAGTMDIEVGVVADRTEAADDRIRPGTLPAGEYATMAYRLHDRRANTALLTWVREQGQALDRQAHDGGDRFAARYEAYLTDPRTEPRKTRRIVELNMKLADYGQG